MFPSYLVLGFDPPARIELVPQFLLVSTLVWMAFNAGRMLGHVPLHQPTAARLAPALVALVALGFAIVPVRVAAAQAAEAGAAQRYAAMWDENDRLLRSARAAAQQPTSVPALPARWGWDWVGPQTTDFPNACVARYYGLAEVRSVPSAFAS
jgi:hypothetical protein